MIEANKFTETMLHYSKSSKDAWDTGDKIFFFSAFFNNKFLSPASPVSLLCFVWYAFVVSFWRREALESPQQKRFFEGGENWRVFSVNSGSGAYSASQPVR